MTPTARPAGPDAREAGALRGRVDLVATGGSIESRLEGGLKVVDGDVTALAQAAAEDVGCSVVVHRFSRLPSYALQVPDLLRLAALVETLGDERRPVVTCGTDLLEEVAFVLDVFAPEAGVVVTGAADDGSAGGDARGNIRAALAAARAHDLARGRAYVAFAGWIRRGCDVVESAPRGDLFAASAGVAVATVRDGAVTGIRPPSAPLPRPQVPARLASVRVVSAHAAMSEPGSLEADAVVIHGFGAGNVPPGLATAVEKRLADGRPVVLCSAAPALAVRRVSGDVGGGARLLDAGAVSAGSLTPRKTAVLAAVCFGAADGARAFTAVAAAVEESHRA